MCLKTHLSKYASFGGVWTLLSVQRYSIKELGFLYKIPAPIIPKFIRMNDKQLKYSRRFVKMYFSGAIIGNWMFLDCSLFDAVFYGYIILEGPWGCALGTNKRLRCFDLVIGVMGVIKQAF